MAQQKGIIRIKGTIGDLTFYKSQDGYLVKEKTSLDGDRIATDPAFARTRENGAEFGEAAHSSKALRDAIRPMLLNAADDRVASRLTQVMSNIRKLDTTSVRGKRTVGTAIVLATAQSLLQGFNFNKKAILGAVLFRPYVVTPATGVISIANLVPINDIAYPVGATHVTLTSAWANVDFNTKISNVQYSPPVNLPIDATSTNVALTPPAPAVGTGTNLFVLQIEFFQQVNAVQYSLNNGGYNALSIVLVA